MISSRLILLKQSARLFSSFSSSPLVSPHPSQAVRSSLLIVFKQSARLSSLYSKSDSTIDSHSFLFPHPSQAIRSSLLILLKQSARLSSIRLSAPARCYSKSIYSPKLPDPTPLGGRESALEDAWINEHDKDLKKKLKSHLKEHPAESTASTTKKQDPETEIKKRDAASELLSGAHGSSGLLGNREIAAEEKYAYDLGFDCFI
jgi:hypothetical protein